MPELKTTHNRFIETLTPRSLLLFGVIGGVSLSYSMLYSPSGMRVIFPVPYLEILMGGIPALGLAYAGYWLQTGSFDPETVSRVGFYASTGAILSVGATLHVITGHSTISPASLPVFLLFISTGSEGAFLGVLLGVAKSIRVQQHSSENEKGVNQRLEAENARLELFAGTVSHDLRNPLSVAQGYLSLAQEDCESPHLRRVEDAHGRMEQMIHNFLVLARNGEPDIQVVDIAVLADEVWTEFDAPAATLSTPDSLTVQVDRAMARQLLENVYRNAIEHCGDSVTVELGELEDGFYIEDDGPGISRELQDDVLKPGVSTGEENTGFGLYIISQIAEVHDWDLSLTTGETGGTRLTFTGEEVHP